MSWFLPFFCLVDLLPKMTSLGLKKKISQLARFLSFFSLQQTLHRISYRYNLYRFDKFRGVPEFIQKSIL